MKTRYFGIFGVLLAALAILGLTGTAFAQQNAQSDTLIYPDPISAIERLRDFGPVTSGKSECHTIYLKNSSADPLIVQSAGLDPFDPGDFSAKPIPSLPVILLHNEIISIASLCYTPRDPTVTTDTKIFGISATSNNIRVGVGASFTGTEIVDPILQKPCFTATIDSNLFGPIIMDGDISHTVTIESNRYDSLWITPDSLQSCKPPFFYSGITSPYHLAPREIKTFTITYSPRSNVPKVEYRTVGTFNITAFNYCNEVNFQLAGVSIPPTADSITTALAAGSTDVLAMIGDNSVTTKTFHFTNTGTTNLKITAVSLKNGKSFAITDIQPTSTLPFTLTPGQSMSVTIAMTTVSNGVYYDEVTITAEQALISMNFQLQGLRKNVPLGVHNTSAITSHATLYPNPTTGSITIAMPGIRNAKIEVLDILGNVITTTTASELWNYDCTEPAGTYFVHISGTEASGKPFQSYDRFIVQK